MAPITTSLSHVGSLLADGTGRYHMDGPWGWGMAIFGWVMMASIVIFLAWLFRSIVRPNQPSGPSSPAGPSNPLEILDRRYAEGEIDREEYLERRADLLDTA